MHKLQPIEEGGLSPTFSKEIKNAFRTGIVKFSLLVLEDNFTINYDNYLKKVTVSELRFVPDNGIFGQAVAKKVDIELYNEENTIDLQDKTVRVFASTNYEGQTYTINYGDFIIQHPENENVNDNTTLTGLDYMIRANVPYNDTIEYPCTLRELAENICFQCGFNLSNEQFRNENFVVEDNQFVNGESCRQVLQGIALSAFSWVRLDEDNTLHFDFNINQEVSEEIDNNGYYNLDFNSKMYGPINRIIIRDSQIEGENITVSDETSIEENGINELVIYDNPFAYTQEKREQLIEAGKELYGFQYLPINSTKLIGYIYLNCEDKIKFKDMQGRSFETYLFNHIIDYDGTVSDNIEVPGLTKTQTQYTYTPEVIQAIKNTQIIVNKANQTITQIIEKQDEQGQQMVNIVTDLEGINTTIESNKTDLEGQINDIKQTIEGTTQTLTNKGGNNIFYYDKNFWTNGEVGDNQQVGNLEEYTDTEIQQISVSGNGYVINKGVSEQKVKVKNDNYTINFAYKKLVPLANVILQINSHVYNLDSLDWKEEEIHLLIDTGTVDFTITSDTDNALILYDLNGTIGTEKQIWTQNPNETRTDTVIIGKGIQVNSSTKNTYARFDADGNRIINKATGDTVTELTDKGIDTESVKANVGEIAGVLIQEIDNQTWISSLL